jgi:hypothetical protein
MACGIGLSDDGLVKQRALTGKKVIARFHMTSIIRIKVRDGLFVFSERGALLRQVGRFERSNAPRSGTLWHESQ